VSRPILFILFILFILSKTVPRPERRLAAGLACSKPQNVWISIIPTISTAWFANQRSNHFPLSSGERAGVRAGVHTNISQPPQPA